MKGDVSLVRRSVVQVPESIFISSTRTFIFTDFAFIILSLMLIAEHHLLENKRTELVSGFFCLIYMATRFH